MRLYWQAAKDYVKLYPEEEPEAWENLETSYDIVTGFAERDIKEGIKKGTRGERREYEIILSKEKLQRQLEQEARQPIQAAVPYLQLPQKSVMPVSMAVR